MAQVGAATEKPEIIGGQRQESGHITSVFGLQAEGLAPYVSEWINELGFQPWVLKSDGRVVGDLSRSAFIPKFLNISNSLKYSHLRADCHMITFPNLSLGGVAPVFSKNIAVNIGSEPAVVKMVPAVIADVFYEARCAVPEKGDADSVRERAREEIGGVRRHIVDRVSSLGVCAEFVAIPQAELEDSDSQICIPKFLKKSARELDEKSNNVLNGFQKKVVNVEYIEVERQGEVVPIAIRFPDLEY